MKKSANLYLAPGFEETEALAPYDCLRRSGVDVCLVSIGDELAVQSSHGVTVTADRTLSEAPEADLYILPGGMPGTLNLNDCQPLRQTLLAQAAKGKLIAAICAAPMVLGGLGLLKGRQATCYPGFEDKLTGATHSPLRVVRDGNIITGIGAGAALEFGLQLVAALLGEGKAEETARQMVCK